MPDRLKKPIASMPRIMPAWLPFLCGALLCTLVLVLWRTLDEHEQATLHNSIKAHAEYLAGSINTDLRSRLLTLQRMARRWEMRGGTPREEFMMDARAYFSDVPGFQALQWVDKDYFVRWVVPLEGNERAQDLNLAFEPKRRSALEKAKENRSPTDTAAVDLVQGGKGFLIYVPIYLDNQFEGFVLATFRIQEWLDYVLGIKDAQQENGDFKTAILMDKALAYKQAGWDELQHSGPTEVADTAIIDHRLSIRVRPTLRYIEHQKTLLPELGTVLGLVLSVLVSSILYLLRKTRREAWETIAAKEALETEIRERKNIQTKFQAAASRLDLAAKACGIGIWSWDISSGAQTWNNLMYSLFDLPPSVAPTYETWRAAIDPDDLPHMQRLFEKALQGGEDFDTDFRINLSTGLVRYLGAVARVEHDSTGAPQRLSGIIWDITERKQDEQRLRQLSQAVEQSPASIVITDTRGAIEYVNPWFTELTGYSLSETLGKNPRILKSGDKGPDYYRELWETITAGRQWHGEFLNKKKNGEEYWESAAISPIRDSQGRITHFLAIKEDITERKRLEDALAAERQRLANILEGTNVGTWEWNVQTGELVCNERWAEMVGYTLSELAPVTLDTWQKLCHPDDVEVSNYLLERHFISLSPYYEAELRMAHKKGGWIWILSRGKVATWTDDGQPLLMSGTQQDITERKHAQEELSQINIQLQAAMDRANTMAQKAEAANIAKSEFLSSMSHEIRTPMTAIIGMAELLAESRLSAEQQQYVHIFKTAGENLLTIINDILDLSKVEAGQMTIESIAFDLDELLERIGDMMAVRAQAKGLELSVLIKGDVRVQRIGDPVRLRQIIINLVSNAIKFTEAGEVAIQVENFTNGDSAASLLFSVRDTGIGIPLDKADIIFDRFTQADSSTTRTYGGTGLGLSIARQLVKLMGGSIWLDSVPGAGSTFYFTASLAEDSRAEASEPRPGIDLSGLRILVVDDTAINRLILREHLARWGARVEEAADGPAALELLRAAGQSGDPFRLVLLDVRMHGMDGFAVASEMQHDPALQCPAIMMLSSENRKKSIDQLKALGFGGYLVKPIKKSEVLRSVAMVLNPGELALQAQQPPEVAGAQELSARILLAEDTEDNRLLVSRFLRKTGCSLTIVANGAIAVEKFRTGSYDIVLMDIEMPEMDGYMATAIIREFEKELGRTPTPIIALTAHAMGEHVNKSLGAGFDMHLSKPFKKADLLEAIKKLTARKTVS